MCVYMIYIYNLYNYLLKSRLLYAHTNIYILKSVAHHICNSMCVGFPHYFKLAVLKFKMYIRLKIRVGYKQLEFTLESYFH